MWGHVRTCKKKWKKGKKVIGIHRYFVHIATMCMVEQEHSVFYSTSFCQMRFWYIICKLTTFKFCSQYRHF